MFKQFKLKALSSQSESDFKLILLMLVVYPKDKFYLATIFHQDLEQYRILDEYRLFLKSR